ncbi:MAG: hypothetical protein ABWY26_02680 [Microbacterium sp.]
MNAHAIHPPAFRSRTFWRHFAEMVVAMYVGMALGGLISGLILGAFDLTLRDMRLEHPEAFMLYMATVMTVPMVAWMRHRGHSWQLSWEMTAAMVIPGFALLCLYWMGVTTGPACSLYCALMVPAMLLVMVFRRDEYGSHAMHAS